MLGGASAAKQQSIKAAKQQSSKAAKQQSSKAVKQQSSKSAKQQSSKAEPEKKNFFFAIYKVLEYPWLGVAYAASRCRINIYYNLGKV